MTLNENSFSAKLYKWFYGDTTLPTSLCPYGRKLIFAYLGVIPFSIIALPYIICEYFDKNYELGDSKISDRMGISVILYFLIFLLVCMGCSIFWWLNDYPKGTFIHGVGPVGTFLWIVVIGFFICWGIKSLYQFLYSITPESNVFIETIKAKKEKICPNITWIKK